VVAVVLVELVFRVLLVFKEMVVLGLHLLSVAHLITTQVEAVEVCIATAVVLPQVQAMVVLEAVEEAALQMPLADTVVKQVEQVAALQ
jgi:hypothetical protein